MKATLIDETVQVKIPPGPPAVAPAFPEIARVPRRRSRRRRRLVRFLILQTIALAALLACVVAGPSAQFTRDTLTTPFAIGVFLFAAALAIIPVLFFGLPRRHDQLRRSR
jgi:hypothetical protein